MLLRGRFNIRDDILFTKLFHIIFDFQNSLIDQNHFNIALAASSITAEELLVSPRDRYPSLEFPLGFQLNCLHGRHRVQAGAETLPPGDKRWTVDLYLAGKMHFVNYLENNFNFFCY